VQETTEGIVYEESVRAITQQEAALDGLWPWTWRFSHDASVLIEDHVEVSARSRAEQLQLFLALTNDANWDLNQGKLERLFWCFRVGSLCLAAEVVLWIVVLARA
jgi:hypothetical protein